MKRKRILRLSLRILAVVVVIALFGFVGHKRNHAAVSQTLVNIVNENELRFINKEDVLRLLNEKNIAYQGVPYSALQLHKTEETIMAHPAVKSANAWTTQNGVLNIDVEQRKPLLRVIDLLNDSYYIDEDGGFMPLSEEYTARVPVATGFIADRFHYQNIKLADIAGNDSLLKASETDDLYTFIKLIQRDTLLSAITEQLYVDVNGNIELIPKCGPDAVILGKSDDAASKMMKLKLFYTQAIPTVGWDAYQRINLNFQDQIICTKKPI